MKPFTLLRALSAACLLAASLLTACRPAATPETTQEIEPQAVFTAAAATAQARLTESALTRAAPTTTFTPTATATQTITPTATLALASPSATGPAPAVTGRDALEFVTDITVPDGTAFKPGESFVKTWQIRNSGTSTWNTSYSLVFFGGEQMGGPNQVPLTRSVAPGETVDLSVNLVAPQQPGRYLGYWLMRSANGLIFGLGGLADQAFYLLINVDGAAATPQPTATGSEGGTPVPTATGQSGVVVSATLEVDDATVTSACPYTFSFTAEFAINRAVSVTYRLEAETGSEITLPAPVTADLGPGVHTVSYTLRFTDSTTGWARLNISTPENVLSNQVDFSLTCQ